MTTDFDPYSQWLEIPADRRPPSYYDLLGLPAFESDAVRIRQCVLERAEKVRRYQLGQHSQAAIQLLGELSRAFDTLTTPDRKQRYDRRLAGLATDDSGMETVVAESSRPPVQVPPSVCVIATVVDEPVAPPVQAPTSPFQPGFVPAPAEPAPRRRKRKPRTRHRPRVVQAGLYLVRAITTYPARRGIVILLRASATTVAFLAKASWWSLRMSDRALCKSLGEENAILHNFLRVAIAGIVLCGLAAIPWNWPRIVQWLKSDSAAQADLLPTTPLEPEDNAAPEGSETK